MKFDVLNNDEDNSTWEEHKSSLVLEGVYEDMKDGTRCRGEEAKTLDQGRRVGLRKKKTGLDQRRERD